MAGQRHGCACSRRHGRTCPHCRAHGPGRIHSRRDSRSGSGIPGVRDGPVAGAMFGSRGSDTTRSRIEFMIRPTVERAAQRLKAVQGSIEKANLMLQREIQPTVPAVSR